MRIKWIAKNMSVLSVENVSILFSFNTPVAACTGSGFIRTEEHYSASTTKHINEWLGRARAMTVPQSKLDNLLGVL